VFDTLFCYQQSGTLTFGFRSLSNFVNKISRKKNVNDAHGTRFHLNGVMLRNKVECFLLVRLFLARPDELKFDN